MFTEAAGTPPRAPPFVYSRKEWIRHTLALEDGPLHFQQPL